MPTPKAGRVLFSAPLSGPRLPSGFLRLALRAALGADEPVARARLPVAALLGVGEGASVGDICGYAVVVVVD